LLKENSMSIQKTCRFLSIILALGRLGLAEPAMAAQPCITAADRLCLFNGRFAVQATWQTAHATRLGQVVLLPDTLGHAGAFRFVDPKNPEFVVKILDGRPNGSLWVFYAGLTSLHVTLKITDTTTGRVKSYGPLGNLASNADTHAFPKSAGFTGGAGWQAAIDRMAFPGSPWFATTQSPDFAADFTYSPGQPSCGERVQLIDQSFGAPNNWCWLFGEGVELDCSAVTSTAYHTYAKAGTYPVTLWISRPDGAKTSYASVVKTVTVSCPQACTFGLVLSRNAFPAAGGSGTVALATAPDCDWTAVSHSPFIHFTPTSGKGSGAISFTVDPNSGTARLGNLTVAGQDLTITQEGQPQTCTYSFAPSSADPVDSAGGIGTVAVQTQDGCPWTVKTSDFIRVLAPPAGSPAQQRTGKGPQSFAYFVAANRGSDRTGTIAFADGSGSFEVPQSGSNAPLHQCQSTAGTLCLVGNRFEIRLGFRTHAVPKGVGSSVQLSPSSGYFTFFDTKNPEILLNMIDGHSVNSHFWLFYGALSNVDYVVTVTDTETGKMKFYLNPSGTF